MTGSFLVPIIVPIVAVLALAFWLGLVYRANAHPGWKAHAEAPGSAVTGLPPRTGEPAGHQGGELAPSPPEHGRAA